MILTQDNEYAAVLDACVLAPMPLCDTLLRLAEDPAMYRPLWGEEILEEVARTLETKLGRTSAQSHRRIEAMRGAFPEALVSLPKDLTQALSGIPDNNDRHVLAVAIRGHAHAIITQNIKHFPGPCLEEYGVLCQTPDDFLIHQFHLNGPQVLDKLDAQAAATNQSRPEVITRLSKFVPGFIALIQA